MRKLILVCVLFGLSLIVGAQVVLGQSGTQTMSPVDQPPKVGDVAPDFSLPTIINGKLTSMKLSDLRGKSKVLLAFYVFDFTGG